MTSSTVNNVILLADSYKHAHYRLYPPGTTYLHSYFESRGGKFPYTVFFGLQYIVKKYLVGPVVTREGIEEAKEIFSTHFESPIFNEEGWNYILEKHGGHLPIRVRAVPEGSIIPTRNVLFTVENTDPKVPWLANFLETVFVQVWYPLTVATISRIQKQIIHSYLEDTSDNLDSLPFSLVDFGYRGVSSVESGAIGSAAHLINFKASDTAASIPLLRNYYSCSMPSFSIPAAEHSHITAWGRDRELDSYKIIFQSFKEATISIVCDSYDVFAACEELFPNGLRKEILDREKRGKKILIRLDSGDPTTIVLKALGIIGKAFGSLVNKKGYKTLPSHIRILQGDGIDYHVIGSILRSMKKEGWSADNIVFGSGGALLQRVDRDTQKYAYKCSYAIVDGKGVDVFKDPITDPGKKSKKGKLSLELNEDTYVTVQHGKGDPTKDLLVPIFEDGKLLREYSFDEIRKRAEISSKDINILEFLEKDS